VKVTVKVTVKVNEGKVKRQRRKWEMAGEEMTDAQKMNGRKRVGSRI
jgi:hypothetical protein